MDPLVPWLMGKVALQAAGCPLLRHDLRDEEWVMLLELRIERDLWATEQRKDKDKGDGATS